jgi:hypothetical protein
MGTNLVENIRACKMHSFRFYELEIIVKNLDLRANTAARCSEEPTMLLPLK